MGYPNIAQLGALIGDPVRAAMIGILMDGTEWAAGKLAEAAGASPQAASAHLARLVEGGLLRVRQQGRHRYYALRDAEIGHAIESLSLVVEAQRSPSVRVDPEMKRARRCYDHIAGQLGVALCDELIARNRLVAGADGFALSEEGRNWFAKLGLEMDAAKPSRRPLARPCIDWTERRPHLAGRLGAALCTAFEDRGFTRRRAVGGRTLSVTPAGEAFLRSEFGIAWPAAV